MKEEKSIYELKLHETTRIDHNVAITRVPGGWIYLRIYGADVMTNTFVPFSNEYQVKDGFPCDETVFHVPTYKEGDYAKIIGNSNSHEFEIGTKVKLVSFDETDNSWRAEDDNGYWHVEEKDMKLIK